MSDFIIKPHQKMEQFFINIFREDPFDKICIFIYVFAISFRIIAISIIRIFQEARNVKSKYRQSGNAENS